ncbi:LuxR C-terminal-related transcriptional regulator [Nocardia sp. CDC159]|uniref:LuxR C-terminal-related transcriptional regulator n=1 Tax=Nocardia pulmonis TaxID=2951408 RepID=A0A9X2IYQ3_9NOCA|nr:MULTISPECIES: LuxR C-terminal-related transcriptional regulator [Nocardia]MCM6777292.1 LuxR C-terminal-related transcriptional regulator [Nocardia pulmonis]MCM6790177.1 LuxR C-terminal-related transcriptional regulator [Nocardia sp. CDC159]
MVATNAVALESLPGAREILRELDAQDREPRVYLIRGRSGTGKSTLLAALRQRLRGRGVTSCDEIDTADPAAAPALIIDDAHTLDADRLGRLTAAVEAGCCTIVAAARPRPHDTALRALADAVSRHGRVLDLRALGVAEIAPFARELGMMVPRPVAQHIHRQTAGIHGGVVAALTAACATRLDAGIAAVDEAVTTWARTLLDGTDPRLLEVFVVATTGTGLDPGELAEVLDLEPDTALDLIDRARASALITDADLLLAPAVAPLRTLVGDRRFLAVQRRLLRARLDAGLLRDNTALLLAESGVRDPQLAEFLCATAEKAGEEAVRYYAAAAAAGADRQAVAVRWAEAAARTGDGETALRLAEPVLSCPGAPPAELAAAVRICAGVWTRRGLAPRAAQLYSWLGPHRVGADWAIGATVQYLAGEVEAAAALSASAAHWPPTEATARAGLIATALAQTLHPTESPSRAAAVTAAAALIQAARADTNPAIDRFLPCTATAIATLLCLSMGEPRRAADALRGGSDRDPHLLVLAAWTAMLGGDEQAAAKTIAALDLSTLSPRDRLLAHGVAIGLARRGGDHTALTLAWQAAHPLFDDVGADLLALLPIGELWLAAIRLRDEGRVSALVDAARELLRRLANPPAWANAFHWYAIQAAIAHERPDELLPPAQALKAAAHGGDAHAAVLADAGRTWVLVLRGQVVQEEVAAAVRRLAGIGLIWDAARLASEAALAAGDSTTATALLKLARSVRTEARPQQRPIPTTEATPQPLPETSAAPADTLLSEREREVAELVLLGLTYREIGARLYISAKTVEHHVARIRRRIGAGSRSELLSMLRAMGHGSLLV